MATKSLIFAKHRGNSGEISGTTYHSLGGENSQGTETLIQRYWLVAGVFRNLRIKLPSVVDSGKQLDFTLRINEADTAMTISFSGSETDKTYTASDISVAVGDRVNFKTVNTGSGPLGPLWTFEFEPTSGNKSCYGHANTDGTGSTPRYFGALCGYSNPGAISPLASIIGVFPCAGTITDLGVVLDAAPGSGTHVFSIWKSTDNGSTFVQQNGSGGTPDTRITYSGGGNRSRTSAFSLSVNAGDLAYITYERTSGGGINLYGGVSIAFDPTTAGQFIVPGLSHAQLTGGTNFFAGVGGVSNGYGLSPPLFGYSSLMGPSGSGLTLGHFRAWLDTAPGTAKSYQFDFTTDLSASPVSGSPTITISGTGTPIGNDATNAFTLADDHVFTLRDVPTSSPAAAYLAWALIGSVLPPPVQKVTQTFLEILIDEAADADPPPSVNPCTGGGTVTSGTNPAAGTSIATATEPHAYVKISPISGSGPYYYGLESINKTVAIYGKALTLGRVKRVLCDSDHGYEASVVSSTFEDTDGALRALGAGLKNALIEYFAADLVTLAAGLTNARRYFRGYCDSYEAMADLEFSITAIDAFTARLTSEDADDLQVPVKTIDSNISDQNPLERMFDKPVPEPYGSVSDEADSDPVGVWELKHVGNITLTGDEDLGNCPHFLVALGAVAKIQSVFGADPLGGDEPTARVKLPASAFGDWRTSPDAFLLIPKGTDWGNIEAADYSDKGGQRYTLVVGKDGHPVITLATEGRIPLVANFCARETTGDATGSILNSGPRALAHYLNNGVLQQATGNWLTQASFGDYSILDTDTFATVHTRCAALSYVIAGIIGDDYTQRGWRDVVADFCRNFGFDVYVNRHGQGCINKLDTSSTGSGATAFTASHVHAGSMRVDQRLDAVENTLRYVYAKNYKTALQGLAPTVGARLYREPYDGKWGSGLQTITNSTSITNLGGTPKGVRHSRLQEYDLVRDQATADAVAAERLALRAPSSGRAEVSFDVWSKDGCDVELGDIVTLNHYDAPWTGTRRCQVRAIEVNFEEWTIRLTVRDVDDLLA